MSDSTPSNRLGIEQPTRGADRNQSLSRQSEPASDDILLPSLEDGITLLDIDGSHGVPILQSLVIDHLLMHDGPAFWVDANGHATTTTLSQIAPSQRLLDEIHVARGFTAYQHYSAICDLQTAVNQWIQTKAADSLRGYKSLSGGEDTARCTPSLIIAPAIDAQYRADDTLGDSYAKTLQARTLARLATYADGYDIPVLVTRTERNGFTEPIATAADHYLECEQTRLGPRFSGDDFETLVYPVDDGSYYQTTFAYWRQLLAARATQAGVEPTPPAASTPTLEGTTADCEAVTATTDPLLDAWTATRAGGR